MNPEITFDDYKSIGTMETALSEHADEAFFELSEKGQKTAEKIFKCLTETDRENREIRRATTVEKLCAIAEADFSEVAAVIETFRKEGRTFLMPPPEVSLNENSLIDISHESLIRKWERLKNWVAEEGQSSRTYRRLAEDALLYKQEKMGFWSDPELKDALEWRENFKPNETWAELYKETGERQYKASFADSMQYLEDSQINRDEEIAGDKRQQDALKSYAAKLRWLVVGLIILLLASFGVAVYAFFQSAEAVKQKNVAEATLERLEESQNKLKLETEKKDEVFKGLESSLKAQEKAVEEAEKEKERADKEADNAILSKAETQKALDEQTRLSAEAQSSKNEAVKKEKEAIDALRQLKVTSNREILNRDGLIFLEQGEFNSALDNFERLLASYDTNSINGRWWALHNLGIINSKLNKFDEAESYYIKALGILGEPQEKAQSQNSNQYFQTVSYQPSAEVNRSKVTTLRRLAQLYRAMADSAATDDEWKKFLLPAIKKYDRLIEIQEQEYRNKEQPAYMVDVYVELADCLSASPVEKDYTKAKERYDQAARIYESRARMYQSRNLIYESRKEYGKQVAVLIKWGDAAKSNNEYGEAENLFGKAIEIQEDENKMDLSPIDLEIADSYAQLDDPGYAVGADGDGDGPPPYGKLAELIRKVNYATTKTNYIQANEVIDLANTYIESGKCRKAEKVYRYFIDISEQTTEQGEYLRSDFAYLNFYVELAKLYQNVRGSEEKAKENYDKAVEELEKNNAYERLPAATIIIEAGDFYFARDDYKQANKLYEHALKQIDAIKETGFGFEYTALQIYVQKRLGDVNRDNARVAADYYKKADLSFDAYDRLLVQASEEKSESSGEELTRYSSDGYVTAEYYIDRAEILEALASLNEVENTDQLKEKVKIARELAERAKAKLAEEQKTKNEKSLCGKDRQ